MTIPMRRRVLSAFALLAVTASTVVGAAANPATAILKPRWTGTWTTALTVASAGNTSGSLTGFTNQSVRQIVRTSVGGEQLRIRISNAYGVQSLEIGHATVGLPVAPGSADLVPGSIRELTFNGGSGSATVYRGGDLLSDPLDYDLPALTELAVTLYFPVATGQTSWHWTAKQTSFVFDGDQAETASGVAPVRSVNSYFFLAGVDVASRTAIGSVVVLGDSISDGFGSTLNASNRWPDELAERIVETMPHLGDPGVLNQALSGNQVTNNGAFAAVGVNGLARLDTDVYGQTGVRTVIVQLGINDIQMANDPAPRVINGLKQLIAQLDQKGIRVLVCTLGPFEGFSSWTPEKEATRLAVNEFLRTSSGADGVIDMDEVLRDPANPSRIKPEFNSGDHIHPNDAGADAMAAAVKLWQL